MSGYLPPVSPLSSSLSNSLLSLLPTTLGAGDPFASSDASDSGDPLDFSQILNSQLLGQGLPTSSSLAGLTGGQSAAGSTNTMMEALMALSLVMLVEKLTDTLPTTTAASPTSPAPATGAPLTSDPANPTKTADEPNTKWPIAGPISQIFHPGHTGTDIAVPAGSPIASTLAGKVIYAGWNTEGYGNLVIVENGDYRTYYAHLSQINVQVGDTVAQGSQVGLSGSTGNSTGPHLHYEVRINGVPVPPEELP